MRTRTASAQINFSATYSLCANILRLKPRPEFLESELRQNVATLAHYLYVLRGCRDGRHLDDWLEAEQRLGSCLIQDGFRLKYHSRYVSDGVTQGPTQNFRTA